MNEAHILDRLAQALYEKMRHLEPYRTEQKPWQTLTFNERDFYESCVETLICHHKSEIQEYWTACGSA